MAKECIAKLEDIGFVWDVIQFKWEGSFNQLHAYKEENGNCLVAQKVPKLGEWVSNQRQQYNLFQAKKNTLMTKECIAKLADIGFIWDVIQFHHECADWAQSLDETDVKVLTEVDHHGQNYSKIVTLGGKDYKSLTLQTKIVYAKHIEISFKNIDKNNERVEAMIIEEKRTFGQNEKLKKNKD